MKPDDELRLFVKVNVYIPADEFEDFINNPCLIARDVVYGIQGMTPTHRELLADIMLEELRKKMKQHTEENE